MKSLLRTNKGWGISMLLLFIFLLAAMFALPDVGQPGTVPWSPPAIYTPPATPTPTPGWWVDLPTPVPLNAEE